LISKIKKFCVKRPVIFELGGANSCFFQAVYNEIKPTSYKVIDNNVYGLNLFAERYKNLPNVYTENRDLLAASEIKAQADLVFSAGLIEHFDFDGTGQVIKSHFDMAKPGGIIILTFPTPTRKYKLVRKLMEIFKLWKFFDERALMPAEVLQHSLKFGGLLESRLMGKMPLTQQIMIFKKNIY